VPVRIIFRGLILFQFPDTEPPGGRRLVAYLINNPTLTGGLEHAAADHPGHGRHEHDHSAEIQILTGDGPGHDPRPRLLSPGVDVDIIVDGVKNVERTRSFDRHVPDLGTIIANGTAAVRNAGRGQPNTDLIQNVISVDRGIVRVKKVTEWDEEGHPLSGNPNDRGERPGSHVLVKFMGSTSRGHMASEVIVEIDDANEVTLRSRQDPQWNGRRRGTNRPNHRVPPDTVEILVTNYEFRRERPVAWGLDYQWLFETVGYRAAELGGAEFQAWRGFARTYDRASFDSETELLLSGPNHTVGRPFPYIESVGSLAPLQPLADQHNPPVCLHGITSIIIPSPDRSEKSLGLKTSLASTTRPKTATKAATKAAKRKATSKSPERKAATKSAKRRASPKSAKRKTSPKSAKRKAGAKSKKRK